MLVALLLGALFGLIIGLILLLKVANLHYDRAEFYKKSTVMLTEALTEIVADPEQRAINHEAHAKDALTSLLDIYDTEIKKMSVA